MNLNENAERSLRMIREAKEVVYDTETSGVDWKANNPIGYVVGAPSGEGVPVQESDVVYVPVRHGGGGNLLGGRPLKEPDDEIEIHDYEKELAKAFEYRNRVKIGPTIGHNLKFDAHMSANVGVMMGRNLICTQNIEALLNEYARSFSLEACAKSHGVVAKKGEELYQHMARQFGGAPTRAQMANYWRLSGIDPLGYEYAVGDGVTNFALYKEQMRHVQDEDLGFVVNLENQLIWTIFRMERRGIKIDPNEVKSLRDATESKIREALLKFPVGFNVRSPKDMKEVMTEAGHTDWPKTEKGNPSFTESWLKKTDIGRDVITIRQMSNLINSFVDPLMNKHVHQGRVHASLNQLKIDAAGTISGRFSCQHPNLQQVPKRVKEIAKPFRRIFVADEGHTFWERDYSQCEPRLFAHYSGDENLVQGYNSKPFRDAHQVVADLLDVERDPTAKRMNMGIFTGMQIKTFASHMGWPEDRAAVAWHRWFENFPGIRRFQDQAKIRLKDRGYVKTILGRKCRLEHPRFAYRGTSKVIQGSNADIIKLKLLEADLACEQNGDIVQVLMTVHDSFNGQYENTEQARLLFKDIVSDMEEVQIEPYNLRVPFLLEGEEGANWSEATFGVE